MRTGVPSPQAVYRRLLGAYGPQGWWPVTPAGRKSPRYRPGFSGRLTQRQRAEVCVGAILTQNTNWGNVEKALIEMHQAGVWELGQIAQTPLPQLQECIRPSGYFRQKARKLKLFARHALSRGRLSCWLSGPLPELRRELLGLWGVGPETADSILLYAGGRPSFVVDAYTVRIGERLGWYREPPYETAQKYLVDRLLGSPALYAELHALLVALAKKHCRVAPLCEGCPLLEVCRYGRAHMARA